mgnify:FL=1
MVYLTDQLMHRLKALLAKEKEHGYNRLQT